MGLGPEELRAVLAEHRRAEEQLAAAAAAKQGAAAARLGVDWG